MKKIIIEVNDLSIPAELNDSESSEKIWGALPVVGNANTWGDEIYFEIPVCLELESDARVEVEVGTLGYWPTGGAFCIFFGKTPASTSDKPRAYSPVNIIGSVTGDSLLFKGVRSGDKIIIKRA